MARHARAGTIAQNENEGFESKADTQSRDAESRRSMKNSPRALQAPAQAAEAIAYKSISEKESQVKIYGKVVAKGVPAVFHAAVKLNVTR